MLNRPRKNILVSLGLLLALDHRATAAAFINLARQKNQPLTLSQITAFMPRILEVDGLVKVGSIGVMEFRKKISNILNLSVSDDEFDAAWNAMLGDPKKLYTQLTRIKAQNPTINYVLFSKTNPIHMAFIFKHCHPEKVLGPQEHNPLHLLAMPLYVSYQSASCLASSVEAAFCDEILLSEQMVSEETSIVVLQQSYSPFDVIKERDDNSINNTRDWALSRGIGIINVKPKQDVAFILQPAIPMHDYGLKNVSGKTLMWSHATPADPETTQTLAVRATCVRH